SGPLPVKHQQRHRHLVALHLSNSNTVTAGRCSLFCALGLLCTTPALGCGLCHNHWRSLFLVATITTATAALLQRRSPLVSLPLHPLLLCFPMLLTPSAACSPRYRRPPLLQPSLLSPASSATATPATFPRHTIEDCSPSIVVASVLSSTTPHPAAPTAFPCRPSLSLLGRCSTRFKRICGAEQCTYCSVRRSSPRGWWSPKLPEGRMQRGKLLQQDRYPGGIGPGATGSSISVNNTTARRAMDYMSECHGTTVAGLPCVRIESCIEKPWLSAYGGCVPSRKY
ncbi:hypothetical protein BHE74_00040606, partial [Ensete ventricosum]